MADRPVEGPGQKRANEAITPEKRANEATSAVQTPRFCANEPKSAWARRKWVCETDKTERVHSTGNVVHLLECCALMYPPSLAPRWHLITDARNLQNSVCLSSGRSTDIGFERIA